MVKIVKYDHGVHKHQGLEAADEMYGWEFIPEKGFEEVKETPHWVQKAETYEERRERVEAMAKKIQSHPEFQEPNAQSAECGRRRRQ